MSRISNRSSWLALLAALSIAAMQAAPAAAQKAEKVQPGEVTGAIGSQVQPMKPNCDTTTATGEKQKEHPPTASMNQAVPNMTAQGCQDRDTSVDTQRPAK